jgi:hypothetical protein
VSKENTHARLKILTKKICCHLKIRGSSSISQERRQKPGRGFRRGGVAKKVRGKLGTLIDHGHHACPR